MGSRITGTTRSSVVVSWRIDGPMSSILPELALCTNQLELKAALGPPQPNTPSRSRSRTSEVAGLSRSTRRVAWLLWGAGRSWAASGTPDVRGRCRQRMGLFRPGEERHQFVEDVDRFAVACRQVHAGQGRRLHPCHDVTHTSGKRSTFARKVIKVVIALATLSVGRSMSCRGHLPNNRREGNLGKRRAKGCPAG